MQAETNPASKRADWRSMPTVSETARRNLEKLRGMPEIPKVPKTIRDPLNVKYGLEPLPRKEEKVATADRMTLGVKLAPAMEKQNTVPEETKLSPPLPVLSLNGNRDLNKNRPLPSFKDALPKQLAVEKERNARAKALADQILKIEEEDNQRIKEGEPQARVMARVRAQQERIQAEEAAKKEASVGFKEKLATLDVIAEKEMRESEARIARLKAVADAEIARMDAEEEQARIDAESQLHSVAVHGAHNEGMSIPRPSDEDDGIDLPEPVKIIERERGYISEVGKDKIREQEKARFDLAKIRRFADEDTGKDLAQPIQQAEEIGGPGGDKKAKEFGFGNLRNPDQEWASEIIKKASAPEGSRAIGKGRQVLAEPTRQEKTPKPTVQYSEHKAVASYIEQGKQKDLQKKFEAVQQAEKGYVSAVDALYPKKVKGMTDDQILAINPVSITWPFTDNRKTLVNLRKLVDEARSKINGSDTTILDADASKKKTNVRNDDEVVSYKDQLINDQVDAFLDQQGVPEGEHDKRKEMELTLKDVEPRLRASIKAYADAYRLVDKSLADQSDEYFYFKLPPKVGVLSSNKDQKRELVRLYQTMSELNSLYEQAAWTAELEKEKNKSK